MMESLIIKQEQIIKAQGEIIVSNEWYKKESKNYVLEKLQDNLKELRQHVNYIGDLSDYFHGKYIDKEKVIEPIGLHTEYFLKIKNKLKAIKMQHQENIDFELIEKYEEFLNFLDNRNISNYHKHSVQSECNIISNEIADFIDTVNKFLIKLNKNAESF